MGTLDHICPACEAGYGQPCRNAKTGAVLASHHPVRAQKARQTDKLTKSAEAVLKNLFR